MFDTTFQQAALFSFLESKAPFLFISESSDLKRISFLSEVINQIDQNKTLTYFRFSGDIDPEHLVHQITERFFIPVRSVNVSPSQQLKDQLDILSQMKQEAVLFIDEAHSLSSKNLAALLGLASSQKESPMPIVLLGKPSLEKRLTQSTKHLAENFKIETLPLTLFQNNFESDSHRASFHKAFLTWAFKKRVRLTSLILLLCLGFFLWKSEGFHPKNRSIRKPNQEKTPQKIKLEQPAVIPELDQRQTTTPKSPPKPNSTPNETIPPQESDLKKSLPQNLDELPTLPAPTLKNITH